MAVNLNKRVTQYSRSLDAQWRYLTDAPTMTRIAGYMKDADNGDIGAMVELNDEMEGKDAHLQSMASRRREALTALPWDVQPDDKAEDVDAATAAADYVRDELIRLKSWPGTLEHLALAIGPGISATELIWSRGRLVETVDVPGHRLQGDVYNNTSDVYLVTEDSPIDGVKMESLKFVVHMPNNRAGFPLRVTITRAQAPLWVLKHFAQADWAGFNEVFGQPVRLAKYGESTPDSVKTEVRVMMENMGADLWAVLPDSIAVEFLEAARGTEPYSKMIEWIEARQTILYLGQTLTTEQGSVGSLALGRVHENVRASITYSDVQKEQRTIEQQVFAPMIAFRFPGRDMPLPKWRRKMIEARNLEAERLEMERIRLARELGLTLDEEVIYERLGLPQPKGGAET